MNRSCEKFLVDGVLYRHCTGRGSGGSRNLYDEQLNQFNPAVNPPVDKPWYQDFWDMAAQTWTTHQWVQVAVGTIGLAVFVILVLKLIDRAQWVDLADDAYDVEDYIDELNSRSEDNVIDEYVDIDDTEHASA